MSNVATWRHGAARYNQGCKCEECVLANRERTRLTRLRRRARFKVTGKLPDKVGHGVMAYINDGCRCNTCTEANRAAGREARRRYAATHRDEINGRMRARYRELTQQKEEAMFEQEASKR